MNIRRDSLVWILPLIIQSLINWSNFQDSQIPRLDEISSWNIFHFHNQFEITIAYQNNQNSTKKFFVHSLLYLWNFRITYVPRIAFIQVLFLVLYSHLSTLSMFILIEERIIYVFLCVIDRVITSVMAIFSSIEKSVILISLSNFGHNRVSGWKIKNAKNCRFWEKNYYLIFSGGV